MTDATLLRAFVDGRSQAAFAELVDRHGGMVQAAARRLAAADADDVAQAVFVLLARRAPRLLGHGNLAGWLYGTTRLCAANARRARGRRAALTLAAAEVAVRQPTRPSTDVALLAHLDDGLARLSDPYRQVLLLRYMEDLTVEQTADRLGLTAAAVMKRSTRGLAKLRDFFARRGLAVDATAVAGTMVAQVVRLSDADRTALATAGAAATGPATALAGSAVRRLQAKPWAVGLGSAAVLAGVACFVLGRGVQNRRTPVAAPLVAAPLVVVAGPPVAANTAGTPKEATDGFLAALVDHDPERAATYLPPGDAAAVRAVAGRYIAELRDGTYAAFPDRLRVQNWSTMVDAANRPVSGTFETLPPIDADVGHVLVGVESAGGHWRVTSARYTDADARFSGMPVTGLSATAGGDPFDYGPAADRWAAYSAAEGALNLTALAEADVPRLISALDRMVADETAFAAALRGSPLAPSDDDLGRSLDAIRRVQAAARHRGVAGVRETVAAFRLDPQLRAAGDRLRAAGQAASERTDAQGDAHHADPRPAAVEPDRVFRTAAPGDPVTIPGPLRMPEWLRTTAAFKRWQVQHDVRTFTTWDDAGDTYTVGVMGANRRADGTVTEVISQIRRYRPDGTLAETTEWEPTGNLAEWATLDATGGRKVWQVHNSGSGTRADGSHGIRSFIHFRPDGWEREYHVGRGDVIDRQSTADAIGEHQQFPPPSDEPAP